MTKQNFARRTDDLRTATGRSKEERIEIKKKRLEFVRERMHWDPWTLGLVMRNHGLFANRTAVADCAHHVRSAMAKIKAGL